MDAFKYIISRLDNTTAWIGLIGLTLQILNFHSALAFLFIALFFVPEGNFTEIFKRFTQGLRKIEEESK